MTTIGNLGNPEISTKQHPTVGTSNATATGKLPYAGIAHGTTTFHKSSSHKSNPALVSGSLQPNEIHAITHDHLQGLDTNAILQTVCTEGEADMGDSLKSSLSLVQTSNGNRDFTYLFNAYKIGAMLDPLVNPDATGLRAWALKQPFASNGTAHSLLIEGQQVYNRINDLLANPAETDDAPNWETEPEPGPAPLLFGGSAPPASGHSGAQLPSFLQNRRRQPQMPPPLHPTASRPTHPTQMELPDNQPLFQRSSLIQSDELPHPDAFGNQSGADYTFDDPALEETLPLYRQNPQTHLQENTRQQQLRQAGQAAAQAWDWGRSRLTQLTQGKNPLQTSYTPPANYDTNTFQGRVIHNLVVANTLRQQGNTHDPNYQSAIDNILTETAMFQTPEELEKYLGRNEVRLIVALRKQQDGDMRALGRANMNNITAQAEYDQNMMVQARDAQQLDAMTAKGKSPTPFLLKVRNTAGWLAGLSVLLPGGLNAYQLKVNADSRSVLETCSVPFTTFGAQENRDPLSAPPVVQPGQPQPIAPSSLPQPIPQATPQSYTPQSTNNNSALLPVPALPDGVEAVASGDGLPPPPTIIINNNGAGGFTMPPVAVPKNLAEQGEQSIQANPGSTAEVAPPRPQRPTRTGRGTEQGTERTKTPQQTPEQKAAQARLKKQQADEDKRRAEYEEKCSFDNQEAAKAKYYWSQELEQPVRVVGGTVAGVGLLGFGGLALAAGVLHNGVKSAQRGIRKLRNR
jgi:hypothetical protein